ncbi:unnamed protein product [Durusdinium trenchii]|uniref:Uncharacterized protein n=1 Tax=Durusdinium trenchii TaxID=1381693 RepID=A0ABP0RUG5_9DINO
MDIKPETDAKMEAMAPVETETGALRPPPVAVSSVGVSPENFARVCQEHVDKLLAEFGGPTQYLQARYAGPEEVKGFADQLDLEFPPDPAIAYHAGPLPTDPDRLVPLRLKDLGFGSRCSSKPLPFRLTAKQLIDEYLTNNFISRSDPILLVERPDAFDYFWTNYVKGAARSATLLMLASVVMEQSWDLSILNPALQASMVTIFARQELMIADSEAVAFANPRLSARGSIRRAHCTLTWLGVFQALQKSGLSAPEVLKRWNQQATSASQVTGMRRVALLNLLGMSAEIVDALLAHLSAHAGSTAFQEDAFANKRLVIGAAPRTSSKEWNQRLCVTSEGMLMMIRFISHAHERKLPGARCKYDKPSLEEALNMSQLLVSALTEAAQQSSKWTCSDLPTIKKLISEHVSESHAHLQKLGKNTAVEAAALERQEFDLVMQTLDHDLDVWKAHLTRSKDRQAAVHFQLMQHRQKRLSASKELADEQIDQVTALMPLDTAQETFKLVETKVKQICQVQQLSDPNQIQTLVVLNWAAPCLFTAEHQRNLILPGLLLLPGDCDAGKATYLRWRKSPVFARGLLEESELVHAKDMLIVEDLSDVALPHTTEIGPAGGRSLLKAFFGGGQNDGDRKALLVIDLTPHTGDLLRAFLSEHCAQAFPAPAYYYGLTVDESHADWLRALASGFLSEGFLKVEGSTDLPLPPGTALPPAEMPAELMQASPEPPNLNSRVITDKIKVDGLATAKVPDKLLESWHDHQRFGSEFRSWLEKARVSENLIDVPPEKADAKGANDKKRTIGGQGGGSTKAVKVEAPSIQIDAANSPAWSPSFIAAEELPSPLHHEATLPGQGRGRPGAMDFPHNRTTVDQVIPPGTCLAGFFKGCWWHDGGDATRTTKKSKTPGTHKEVDERKDILFTLESSNDLIQVGPGLVTLGQSVAEKQSSMPSVKVAYHTIKESPTAANPAFFKLTRNHDMYFQVGDIKIEDLCMHGLCRRNKFRAVEEKNGEKQKVLPLHHLAGLVPWHVWEGPASHIVWNVKWSATKGLLPVRPVVLSKCEIKLPAGKAVEISGNAKGNSEAAA